MATEQSPNTIATRTFVVTMIGAFLFICAAFVITFIL